jgi:hypothetical protein
MTQRTFTDSLGRAWNVWNVDPSRVERRKTPPTVPRVVERRHSEPRALLASELADGWLAFETTNAKRRLANYPEAWVMMSDIDLERLCERATAGRPPR